MRYLPLGANSFCPSRWCVVLLIGGGLGLFADGAWAQTQTPPSNASPFRLLPNYGADKQTRLDTASPFRLLPDPGKDKVYSYVERMPFYKDGGNEGLTAFIKAHRPALPPGAKGLFMDFVVDKNGKLTRPKLTAMPSNVPIPPSTYQEVTRMLKLMKDFVPGQQNGRPANVSLTVPLVPLSK